MHSYSFTLFLAKKIASLFLLPPLAPLLLTACGLVLIRWRPRLGYGLAGGGVLYGLLACLPLSVDALSSGLERAPAVTPAGLKAGQVIVVLSGGQRRFAPEYGGQTVNSLSLERARYGARLARQTGLPLLVTGGAPNGGIAEGELMRRILVDEFHITPRWTETTSLDTRENASHSAPLLRAAKVRTVILVTHAMHMRRAQREFEREGFTVVPAPTVFFSSHRGNEEAIVGAPGGSSAFAGWFALHEWLGLLAQAVRPG